MSNDRLRQLLARDQVRALNGLYNHFIVFACVLGVLAAINVALGDRFWVHWVLLGWGLGIGLHAYLVFFGKRRRDAATRARLSR
jgi:cyanate permease